MTTAVTAMLTGAAVATGLRRQKSSCLFCKRLQQLRRLIASSLTDTVAVENKGREPDLTPGTSLRTPPGDARAFPDELGLDVKRRLRAPLGPSSPD